MNALANDGRANLDTLNRAAEAHGDEVRDYLMGVLACRVEPAVWDESLAEAMRGRVSSRTCGQRAVRLSDSSMYGAYSDSCLEPKGHAGEHRDADGFTWIESVR